MQSPPRLLGPSSWCTVEENQLLLELTQGGELQAGDSLSFKAGQRHLVDKLQAGTLFNGTVLVANCLKCTRPSAVIDGPKVKVPACKPLYRVSYSVACHIVCEVKTLVLTLLKCSHRSRQLAAQMHNASANCV
jgi:hypothetical protein